MTWYAGNNSTNGGNNTGWVFTAPSGAINYTLTCSVGTYSYTGQSATFTYTAGQTNYTLTCAVGSYTVAGKDATFIYKINYSLTCSVGSYAVIGQDATLAYVNKMQTIWGGARPWDKIVLETKHFEEDDEEQVIMLLIQELAELI